MFKATREAIHKASTERQIVDLLRECVQRIPQHTARAFPLACQSALVSGEPVSEVAYIVLRAQMHYTGPHDVALVLTELSQTYGVAAARLAVIKS